MALPHFNMINIPNKKSLEEPNSSVKNGENLNWSNKVGKAVANFRYLPTSSPLRQIECCHMVAYISTIYKFFEVSLPMTAN